LLKVQQEEKARKRDKLETHVQFCMDLAVECGGSTRHCGAFLGVTYSSKMNTTGWSSSLFQQMKES
jgi:hypothetical protein